MGRVASMFTLALMISSCGTQIAVQDTQEKGTIGPGAPTSSLKAVPVFSTEFRSETNTSGIRKQNSTALTSIFGDAKTSTPAQPWMVDNVTQQDPSGNPTVDKNPSAPNGYSIAFYDFYGVSFAYLNFIDRKKNTDPNALIKSYDEEPTAGPQPSTWSVATYASGANNKRTVLSHFTHGVPVLRTIFGPEGEAVGFDAKLVSRYVMPYEGAYWAHMKDGRYFDLQARTFVSIAAVDTAKADYDRLLDAYLENQAPMETLSHTDWGQADMDNLVSVADLEPQCDINNICTSSLKEGEGTGTSITKQSSIKTCGTRSYLWWSWVACDTVASKFTGSISWDTYRYSEWQAYVDGWLEGCGPVSMGRLLQWYKDNKGKNATMTDYSSAVKSLRSYMNSYRMWNGETATNPWNYIDGANNYLRDRGAGMTIGGTYGYPPLNWQAQVDILHDKFSKNEPVVGLHFSNYVQHFGIISQYQKGHYSDLWVFMPSRQQWLNQSAWWSAYLSGTYAAY